MSTAAQLIHSPPTNSLLTDSHAGRDLCAARYAPCRASSVATLHRRYEGDIESSDDPHDVDSSIEERPQMHANRGMKHELGYITPRPALGGFASSEKVLPVRPPPLPSYHSVRNSGRVCLIHISTLRGHPNRTSCRLRLCPSCCRSQRRHLSCAPRARTLP